VALQDFKFQGKIVWKKSSKTTLDDHIQINLTHCQEAHQLGSCFSTP
jgi:hypothetical protein